ncbi:hypothetical protein J6590_077182, partial [Homalodisca vitripennis]
APDTLCLYYFGGCVNHAPTAILPSHLYLVFSNRKIVSLVPSVACPPPDVAIHGNGINSIVGNDDQSWGWNVSTLTLRHDCSMTAVTPNHVKQHLIPAIIIYIWSNSVFNTCSYFTPDQEHIYISRADITSFLQ